MHWKRLRKRALRAAWRLPQPVKALLAGAVVMVLALKLLCPVVPQTGRALLLTVAASWVLGLGTWARLMPKASKRAPQGWR